MQGDPGLETPPDEVYTVLSDQTVQEFLDKQTKGMDGPSGALRIALRHKPCETR